MKSYLKIFIVGLIGILTLSNCSKTIGINLSKTEIKALDTIFLKQTNYAFFDTKWIFYEKNICQFSTNVIRKKTYTGTWSIKGDSIFATFFYRSKNAPKRQSIHINEVKKINPI